jgi:hypothetical protein
MTILHNTNLNPQQVFLRSNEYTILNNDTKKSSISFDLKTLIKIPNNVDAYIQINSFKFMNAFYNINASNNILYFSLNGGGETLATIYEIEIPIGNYSVSTLLTFLNTELTSYIVLSYVESTFKISFVSNTYTFIFRTGANNCLKLLGFTGTTIETNDLTSSNLINLAGTQILYLSLSNIHIQSNASASSSVINILESINVDVIGGSSKSFYNSSNLKYRIDESSISRIDVNIYDEHNNLVDFNNTDWFLSITFIFAYKNEYRPPQGLELMNAQDVATNQDEEPEPIGDTPDEI